MKKLIVFGCIVVVIVMGFVFGKGWHPKGASDEARLGEKSRDEEYVAAIPDSVEDSGVAGNSILERERKKRTGRAVVERDIGEEWAEKLRSQGSIPIQPKHDEAIVKRLRKNFGSLMSGAPLPDKKKIVDELADWDLTGVFSGGEMALIYEKKLECDMSDGYYSIDVVELCAMHFYLSGKGEKAIEFLREAIKIIEDGKYRSESYDGIPLVNRVMVYAAVRDLEKRLRQYEESMIVRPNPGMGNSDGILAPVKESRQGAAKTSKADEAVAERKQGTATHFWRASLPKSAEFGKPACPVLLTFVSIRA